MFNSHPCLLATILTFYLGSIPEREPEKRKLYLHIICMIFTNIDSRATTSKEGSRRANYPILTRGGSDNAQCLKGALSNP